MNRSLALLPALAFACSYGLVDIEQLESPTLESSHWEADGEASSLDGLLSVQGDGRDFTLTVEDTVHGAVSLEVHTPGQTDFSVYDGLELTLNPTLKWTGLPTGFALYDEEGLSYALAGSDGNTDVETLFGSDFASYGEELSATTEDGFDYTWHPIAFATDEGVVELLPGEVEELVIDGQTWRVIAIAAYTEEAHPDTPLPGCDSGGDLLSYEMVRVDEAAEEAPTRLDRADGLPMAARTCH